MRYVNMMWRYKLIILCTVFFAFNLNAQKEIDTFFFVWNASSLYELKPKEGVLITYTDFARDSTSFHKGAPGKTLIIAASGVRPVKEKQKPYLKDFYKYDIDAEGRPSEYSALAKKDSALIYSYKYYYRIFNRPDRIVYHKHLKMDTTNYTYDRSGNLAAECTRDSCTQRLYDSKQRVIVIRNAWYSQYSQKRGDFTYEYNEEGKLIRRRFLESQSGIVLCTDTIEYKFEDLGKRYLTRKHFIHIAGKEGWIPIDEMHIDKKWNKVIYYELFHGAGAPQKEEYFYNESGLISSAQTDLGNYKTEDIYLLHADSDTIRRYRLVEEKKGVRKMLSSEIITKYNAAGLITERRIKRYSIEKIKRKWQVLLYEDENSTYHWN